MHNFYNPTKLLEYNQWQDNSGLVLNSSTKNFPNLSQQGDYHVKLIKLQVSFKQIKLILEITPIRLPSKGEIIC
jgi:hypothetical protein